MFGISFAWMSLDVLILFFVFSAFCHLVGLRDDARSLEKLNLPRHFYLVTGAVELLTALLLIMPQTRVWGVAPGYMVTFSVVVMLLGRSRYAWSAVHIVVMAALVPAVLLAV